MSSDATSQPKRRGRPPKVTEAVPARERIVAGAGRLMRQRGYHAVGLNELVAASRAPKGSLYHYFPRGKEQIAGEAMRAGGKVVNDRIEKVFATGGEASECLALFAQRLAQDLERSGFRDGCPVATTALDAASESDEIQTAAAECFDGWRDTVVAWLIRRGHTQVDASELAVLLLSAFEGALIVARSMRDVAPLYGVADSMGRRLPL